MHLVPSPVPRGQFFAWNGVSVRKVVTFVRNVMKVEPFGETLLKRLKMMTSTEMTDVQVDEVIVQPSMPVLTTAI
jgi:hypothetical protein